MNPGRWVEVFIRALIVSLCVAACVARAQSADEAAAAALRETFASLKAQPQGSPFQQPLYLQSNETSSRLQGDVYALVDHSYDEVRHALSRVEHWCNILILHLNVKYCRPARVGSRDVLTVALGRKFDEPLANAYLLQFDFRIVSDGAGYLELRLAAPKGPLSTSDYKIVVQVAPSGERQAVVHMGYGYAYGVAGRWAMQAYLATIGSDKVGFSVVGRGSGGKPSLVGGVRGVVERNTMRYYLAIDAFLGSQRVPEQQRVQQSLQDWFDATERYARQLHEVERQDYLEMKRRELRRQETEVVSAPG
jgi:hypothetical protein